MSGGPQWLGVMLVSLAAAAALLAPTTARRAQAMLAAAVILPPLLLAELWNRPELQNLRDTPAKLALVVLFVVGGVAVLTRLFERRPEALALAIVATLPFRIPLGAGANTANLLLPLYVVIAAGVIVAFRHARAAGPVAGKAVPLGGTRSTALSDATRGSDVDGSPRFLRLRGRTASDWLLLLLAGSIVLYALQAAYSNDLDHATENVGFFLVPFALMLRLLLDCKWTPRLLRLALAVSVGEALLFAVIGFGQDVTRHLFWNPEVIKANPFQPYFRVNSLFWDPNILGRYLAIVTVALMACLMWARERRSALLLTGAAAVTFAGLVLTYSQSSFAALLAGLVVLAALRWSLRWTAVAAVVGVVAAIVVSVTVGSSFKLNLSSARALDRTTSGRADLVRGGVELARRRPVWGFGSGSFQKSFEKESAQHARVAASHTEPVTIVAEQGALGLIVYVALLVAAFATLLGGMRGVMPGVGKRPAYIDGDWGRAPPSRETIIGRAIVGGAFTALVAHTMAYAAFFSDPLTWTFLALGIVLARSLPPARPGAVPEPIAPPVEPPAEPPVEPPAPPIQPAV